ncbi:MAG: glycosyltransferase family 4 protein [Verrucomicrobiota bacterium]|jgi:glycosyltransferase involved in cell wall biosynthesis
MKPLSPESDRRFVVATPARTVCDDNARALERHGRLRFIALGTRRGTTGVPPERTRLNPWLGLLAYATARTLPDFRAVSFRYRLHPWFDRWVLKQLEPGDHIISSYGHTNACFQWVRQHGGKTFLDGGNSHPDNFWNIITEEHRRWNCPYPPLPRHHYERSVAMMELVDYVLSPSSYVTKSFLARGFKLEQILRNVYPVDLSCFSPAREPRPASRPLTLICTGSLSLRKGTPYLLEAVRIVRSKIPGARLLLTRIVEDSMRPILSKYRDLPIEWSPPLPHAQLAERLRSADIFILPSLEDGFARTVTEALACGLPAITTPNTGACDLIQSGINGEVVPIRDPQAIADAVLKWADKILAPDWQPRVLVNAQRLSFEHFEKAFIEQLRELGF